MEESDDRPMEAVPVDGDGDAGGGDDGAPRPPPPPLPASLVRYLSRAARDAGQAGTSPPSPPPAVPVRANCAYVPGGVRPDGGDGGTGLLVLPSIPAGTGRDGGGTGTAGPSSPAKRSRGDGPASGAGGGGTAAAVAPRTASDVVRSALSADALLRRHALLFHCRSPGGAGDAGAGDPPLGHRLPSLSLLAESALVNPLTAVGAGDAAAWAEAMVWGYAEGADGGESPAGGGGGPGAVDALTGEALPDDDRRAHAALVRSAAAAASAGEAGTRRAGRADRPGLASFLSELHSLQQYGSKNDAEASGSESQDVCGTSPRSGVKFSYLGRPCGYVFRRGDIAWNCRTCQSDPTCVLCERCFRESDHEGHEVLFHRTSPGGCCDCGDLEAWRRGGMCGRHRPPEEEKEEAAETGGMGMAGGDGGGGDQDYDAVRASLAARERHAEAADGPSPGKTKTAPSPGRETARPLPPRLAAALSCVIGAAVQSAVYACESSASCSDLSQWRLRAADLACRSVNGAADDEDYRRLAEELRREDAAAGGGTGTEEDGGAKFARPVHFLDASIKFRHEGDTVVRERGCVFAPIPVPGGLHLRLHNDDVHTFEDVIRALSARRAGYTEEERDFLDGITPADTSLGPDSIAPLVGEHRAAQALTTRVDAEGQVTVRAYGSVRPASAGFARLRSGHGLHCSVATGRQIEAEERARALLGWCCDLCGAHPAAGAALVQALADVSGGREVLCSRPEAGDDGTSRGVAVWTASRSVPSWSGTLWDQAGGAAAAPAWRRRMEAFPPHLESSYLTREEGRSLFGLGMSTGLLPPGAFAEATGADPDFYSDVPYRLPDARLAKSPHGLWGTAPLDALGPGGRGTGRTHPLLERLASGRDGAVVPPRATTAVRLVPTVMVVDTDLRKYGEGSSLTRSLRPHGNVAGLHVAGGAALVEERHVGGEEDGGPGYFDDGTVSPAASPETLSRIVASGSYAAPSSALLSLLLLDPYPPKGLRKAVHRLYLTLLTDSRFKSRFAAAFGAVAYRPTSTLFCAGVGTESDTLLGFTVQILTTGSLVRALGCLGATRALLCRDDGEEGDDGDEEAIAEAVRATPVAHTIVRAVHGNILGSTEGASSMLPAAGTLGGGGGGGPLVYQPGERPLSSRLPCPPDDKYIDSRCMKHKRIPHLLRDLEYIYETPGTATRLLQRGDGGPSMYEIAPSSSFAANTPQPSPTGGAGQGYLAGYGVPDALDFPTVWARLLRSGQGIDPQKRRVSGGHVEYEDERWFGAYGLSLNLAGTGDSLSESVQVQGGGGAAAPAVGNLFAALFREVKLWLYREGLLEPDGGRASRAPHDEASSLQRSTLHVSAGQVDERSVGQIAELTGVAVASSCDVACERGVRNLPEAKLALLEAAVLHSRNQLSARAYEMMRDRSSHGPVMGDWLKVPHSPLAGDGFSFHLPLHRALARSILCFCASVVSEEERADCPEGWWKLPLFDDGDDFLTVGGDSTGVVFKQDSLSAVLRSTHKSSNFRVVWSAGPDCSTPEAQLRKSRLRMLSSQLASTKVVHSLCDHPLRCIAAAEQIEHHMWAKNGQSMAGMAINYSAVPLCRSMRDLDIAMVQLSASGFNVGLGARRVFGLLTTRFSLDGYLSDPDRRNSFGKVGWVKPPRMQEPDHAEHLAESFFKTVCVIVSDLPPPPPVSEQDNSVLKRHIRRELLHALAVEPKSHSEAMNVASAAVSRREESDDATRFRAVFTEVLTSIAQQRNHGSRGPPTFDLKPEGCGEYDPSFHHLRKTEHQHAMDNIARLRRQRIKRMEGGVSSEVVLPLVSEPPPGHNRFLPSRLLLHLPAMYAAIRRFLMYVLFNGQWLPPDKPSVEVEVIPNEVPAAAGLSPTTAAASPGSKGHGRMTPTSPPFRSSPADTRTPSVPSMTSAEPNFTAEAVSASSKSFLEVLHILTLQVHTLEECSCLHNDLPFLDLENVSLSAGININSYLEEISSVPESLADVWALQCYPEGPLPSQGSGLNRGSVLGLLIALYEHRDNAKRSGATNDSANNDHGGARALSADGLKWLLRFLSSLVNGADSMASAYKSATSGIPVTTTNSIQPELRRKIKGMLDKLPNLWPVTEKGDVSMDGGMSAASEKSKAAQKAAQKRALARMKNMQSKFADSISAQYKDEKDSKLMNDENLCIICKCDDDDGVNGPMGYLGHVQRSRVSQLASDSIMRETHLNGLNLSSLYRVVGEKGCQLRSSESMESTPVAFLPRGSIVEVLQSKVSASVGLRSRRVLVRHAGHERRAETCSTVPGGSSANGSVAQGWASLQSWQGYVILSPLSSLCYTNTRWGPTRPIVRQCGHAAHLRCVEAHCLSLHQRSAGNQAFDGRFSANIEDGEFLCPLCKQLSNILIPDESNEKGDSSQSQVIPLTTSASATMCEEEDGIEVMKNMISATSADVSQIRNVLSRTRQVNYSDPDAESKNKAIYQFGSHLSQGMQQLTDISGAEKAERHAWHDALRRWDFEDDNVIKNILRLSREQLIAWAAVGYGASSSESSGRGLRKEIFGEVDFIVKDPWSGYSKECQDSHPMLLDLRRLVTASAGLFDVLTYEIGKTLGTAEDKKIGSTVPVFGDLISDILEGKSWMDSQNSECNETDQWRIVSSLIASMLCHVSREDAVAPRLEARAVAAAMWVVNGRLSPPPNVVTGPTAVDMNGGMESDENQVDNDVEISRAETDDAVRAAIPPTPLSISRAERNLGIRLESDWGVTNPFHIKPNSQTKAPFRPAVASAFLYVPLLAWDLNILAGAVFSSLLSGSKSSPQVTCNELLQSAKILLVGRLTQVLLLPGGFVDPENGASDPMDYDDYDGQWDGTKTAKEGEALKKLLLFCRRKAGVSDDASIDKYDDSDLCSAVGNAVLPFCRSLVLLLRASLSTVRQRVKKGQSTNSRTGSMVEALTKLLNGPIAMSTENGFHLMTLIGAPPPSDLATQDPSYTSWHSLISRWLLSLTGFERYHGTRGIGLGFDAKTESWSAIDQFNVATSILQTGQGKVGVVVNANNDPSSTPTMLDLTVGENNHTHDTVVPNFDFEEDLNESASGAGVAHKVLNDVDDASDPGAHLIEPDGSKVDDEDGDRFSHVSQSAMISFQPSILGANPVGPGPRGSRGDRFEYNTASGVMRDLSHLGTIHIPKTPMKYLVKLPKSFVELYSIVNKVKGRDGGPADDLDDESGIETAICLLTGSVMRSGLSRRIRSNRSPGACTRHSRKAGSGIGIFFLVQKCTVLLMHNNKSAYSPSLYVDENGEEDVGLRRGRPLYFSEERHQALEALWGSHGIPREVSQIRSTSDRVIRDNWY